MLTGENGRYRMENKMRKTAPNARFWESLGYVGFVSSQRIPARLSGHKTDRAFLYTGTKQPVRVRPLAWMELSAESGAVLRLNNCWAEDFMDTAAYPLDATVDYSLTGCTAMEQLERVRKLTELYPAVREAAFEAELTREQRDAVKAYARLLEQVTPPALMPYYRALGADFFAWLDEVE